MRATRLSTHTHKHTHTYRDRTHGEAHTGHGSAHQRGRLPPCSPSDSHTLHATATAPLSLSHRASQHAALLSCAPRPLRGSSALTSVPIPDADATSCRLHAAKGHAVPPARRAARTPCRPHAVPPARRHLQPFCSLAAALFRADAASWRLRRNDHRIHICRHRPLAAAAAAARQPAEAALARALLLKALAIQIALLAEARWRRWARHVVVREAVIVARASAAQGAPRVDVLERLVPAMKGVSECERGPSKAMEGGWELSGATGGM